VDEAIDEVAVSAVFISVVRAHAGREHPMAGRPPQRIMHENASR
jgi:hypothetical protein